MRHVAQWVSRTPPYHTLPAFLNLNCTQTVFLKKIVFFSKHCHKLCKRHPIFKNFGNRLHGDSTCQTVSSSVQFTAEIELRHFLTAKNLKTLQYLKTVPSFNKIYEASKFFRENLFKPQSRNCRNFGKNGVNELTSRANKVWTNKCTRILYSEYIKLE